MSFHRRILVDHKFTMNFGKDDSEDKKTVLLLSVLFSHSS